MLFFLALPKIFENSMASTTQSEVHMTIFAARSRLLTAQRDARGSVKPSLDLQRPWDKENKILSHTRISLGKSSGDHSCLLACFCSNPVELVFFGKKRVYTHYTMTIYSYCTTL
jgi:hypothetical protein